MTPSAYKPKSVTEFIGGARRRAEQIQRIVEASKPGGDPIKILLLGNPGIGKTELANFFLTLLGCDKWHTTQVNGTQVKMELVEEIARSLQYKEMFGQYRVIRIEEVDKVPVVAQVRLLTLLDDMPPQTAMIATSNCRIEDLEERFQSRFIVMDVTPPSQDEIEALLTSLKVVPHTARQIATFACGNVRQALLDATSAMFA